MTTEDMIRLAETLARRYARYTARHSWADLRQEALVAMLTALPKYDASGGYRVEAFARLVAGRRLRTLLRDGFRDATRVALFSVEPRRPAEPDRAMYLDVIEAECRAAFNSLPATRDRTARERAELAERCLLDGVPIRDAGASRRAASRARREAMDAVRANPVLARAHALLAS